LTVNAIQQLRRYVVEHSGSPAAEALARLSQAVAKEDKLALSDLYSLDWDSFELAIEVLRDWRIDRHYAAQTDLFEVPATTPELELEPAE
jgi:hypothetical protein